MKIDIENLSKVISSNGKSILSALLENNIEIANYCNGKGTCAKCKVLILEGEVSPLSLEEKNSLTEKEISSGIRLACLTYPKSDIKIKTLSMDTNIKVLDLGEMPDFIMNFKDGFGLAIDIGTTTVAIYLVDLSSGQIIDKNSAINSQSKYGLDVMTRISFEYENNDGMDLLQKEIVDSLNAMIDELVDRNGLSLDKISDIVVAANTTMLHMLVGKDARSLGKYPYKPEFVEALNIRSKDIGLKVDAKLYTLANVSAFVGSDIIAGVYLTDLINKENTLFVDIGTNGEIVLKAKDKLYCCSTAAGPALEGMNIECGMRAEGGAIEAVKINEQDIILDTIDKQDPRGICGSGLLSAVTEIIKARLVNKRGRIIDPDSLDGNDFRKKLVEKNASGDRLIILDKKANIYLSQKDIRQVQLAKGAILSGFLTLLSKEDMEIEELKSVIIAGGFGSHLKKSDITGVGILPKQTEDLITYVGNSSLIGAYMALMNDKIKKEMEDLSKKISYIELSTSENYERTFAKAMQF
ncbi:ASKHA domain-containing protein [uncultured Anaerococcus sp.]|uniref:ASKHA domain-containing protein n=1 Tax=uncultured Anaerococcus sp. TaxID=293428 RepID=UPI0026180062|nr:ASKHA domain-containing protein [uncultured Anaerococcus sp.]